jgi:hypothetical protein
MHMTGWWVCPGFVAALLAAGCANVPAVLTQQVEARRLASELSVQFSRGADAGNRAVMADTDELSAAAAREAQQARQSVDEAVARLRSLLTLLSYSQEQRQLDAFTARFEEYRTLDEEILSLAVENTNLKAQRLSFGASREALGAFGKSVDAAAGSAAPVDRWRAEAIAARARAALLEVQAVQAPHIAESDDGAMTRMEEEMGRSEAGASRALSELKAVLSESSESHLAAAATALERFRSVNREIITLSRRNSEVRSLALSLGRKRTVTAECEDHLRALEESLAARQLSATR